MAMRATPPYLSLISARNSHFEILSVKETEVGRLAFFEHAQHLGDGHGEHPHVADDGLQIRARNLFEGGEVVLAEGEVVVPPDDGRPERAEEQGYPQQERDLGQDEGYFGEDERYHVETLWECGSRALVLYLNVSNEFVRNGDRPDFSMFHSSMQLH